MCFDVAVHDDREHRQKGVAVQRIHGDVGQHGPAHPRSLLPGETPLNDVCGILFYFFRCCIGRDK